MSMGKVYESITPKIQRWMAKQQMFFVATAPLSGDGTVNLSPKGHDTLRVLDEHTLAFMDCGGSGVETIAHVRENGRICIMMCAFSGPPKIYRFQGEGSVVTPNDEAFAELAALFVPTDLGIRSIIQINVRRISDSCGFGVPLYDYVDQRTASQEYLAKNGVDSVREYTAKNNAESINGLPAVTGEEAAAFAPPTR